MSQVEMPPCPFCGNLPSPRYAVTSGTMYWTCETDTCPLGGWFTKEQWCTRTAGYGIDVLMRIIEKQGFQIARVTASLEEVSLLLNHSLDILKEK